MKNFSKLFELICIFFGVSLAAIGLIINNIFWILYGFLGCLVIINFGILSEIEKYLDKKEKP